MTREKVIKAISMASKRHRERVGFDVCRINGFIFILDEYDFIFTEEYLEITHSPRIIFS